MTEFYHLHVHNMYSQLDGYGSTEQYVVRAKKLDQKYLAITNHGVADGFLEFQSTCKKNGIIPIFGCELYIVSDINKKEDKRYHIIVLVKNDKGLQNLYRMLSIAYLDGFYRKPRIDPKILLEHREGLIFSSACALSFINMPNGIELMKELNDTNDFYLEVMPHDYTLQKNINKQKYTLSVKYDIPLIASNDCHYPLKGDAKVQEVLLAIQRKAKWNDPNRWRFEFTGLHLRSYTEMLAAFKKQGTLPKKIYEKAISNTIEVAELCQNFSIPKLEVNLPRVPGYEDRDEDELLVELVKEGLKQRVNDDKVYRDRIKKELEIIRQFKFQRYFLIVWEIMKWCQENNILTGIGRGSVGSALTAFALGITHVDPIKYNLPFERFLRAGRQDFPDIDMDFEDIKRDRVKQHLIDMYGENNVVALSTFLTLKGRGALRDVARVFDVPLNEVDEASKSIPNNYSIKDALNAKIEGITKFRNKYSEVVDIAIKLDGQVRGSGRHAAGMCISDTNIRNGDKCYVAKRSNELTTNLDMNEVEYRGLIKFDVLGLSALTVLNHTKNLIKETYDIDIIFEKIPLNNLAIFKEISKGNNAGIFQFGAKTTSNLCVEMGIENFNHLVLANALSRPGTLQSGLTASFIKRKHGFERVEYIHPKLKDLTKDTYGIIVFQEQVMWLMNKLAGLDWSICDDIRKVIGKSKGSEEFNKYKDVFIDGCKKQETLSKPEADHVWEQLASFSSYAFNKSHSVEYSLIAYYGAYLKHKFPKEYMCSLLTFEAGHKEEYIAEAKRLGLEVILPTRGLSDAILWKSDKNSNKIYAPFIEIKGVGEATAEKLAKKKSNGFAFFDLQSNNKDKYDLIVDQIEKINLLEEDGVRELQKFFEFPILSNRDYFDNLGLDEFTIPEIESCNLEDFKGNIIDIKKCVKVIKSCTECDLQYESKYGPVSPSFGRYNIMVIGEAPGATECKEGAGFVGPSGKLFWGELNKYGLNRDMFHTSNVVKCFPQVSKTPNKKHINTCANLYLYNEIKELKPIMILSFGNTGLKFFKDKDSGISEYNGKAEWNNEYNCWLYFCLHPASVLHNSSNRASFIESVEGFASKLRMIGGNYLSKKKYNFDNKCPYGANFGVDNNEFEQCGTCKIWERCAKMKSTSDWIGE